MHTGSRSRILETVVATADPIAADTEVLVDVVGAVAPFLTEIAKRPPTP